jgi:hypothetical protein
VLDHAPNATSDLAVNACGLTQRFGDRTVGNPFSSFPRALVISAVYLVVVAGVNRLAFVRRDVTA